FQAVKILVEEAGKRDMHLWFDDDGGYPSGFAGGKFTNERPDLRMQALASPQRVPVTAGQQYSYKVDPRTICVLAVNLDTGATEVLDSSSGTVNWTVPAGNWEIVLPRSQFRSGPTRSANNQTGAKEKQNVGSRISQTTAQRSAEARRAETCNPAERASASETGGPDRTAQNSAAGASGT